MFINFNLKREREKKKSLNPSTETKKFTATPRNSYLLRLSVRVAGMVDEPGDISLAGGINKEVGLQCHEVEMGVLPSGVVLPSSLELLGVQDLPDILHDKRAPKEKEREHL